jgi:hypothetical protein
MHKSIPLLPFLLVAGGVAFGAVPVARVISTEPVAIDWIAAPARNFTPVGLGGDVRTGSASALLQFQDGTSVVLQPNSELKIEGSAGKPVIRVISGSAEYKLSPKSHVRIANGGGVDPVNTLNAVNKVVEHATTQTGVVGQTDVSMLNAAMVYKASPVPTVGVILPSSPVSTGSFSSGKGASSFFSGAALDVSGTSAQIILPNRSVVINLTAVVNPVNNAVTYVVASVTQTIQLPNNGGTATITVSQDTQTVTLPNGTSTTVPVDKSASTGAALLIGSTANVTPSSTSADQIKVSFTPPNTTTALTDTQAAAAVTNVGSTAVTTAITTNQIPSGTLAPTISQVQQGSTFSSSAP